MRRRLDALLVGLGLAHGALRATRQPPEPPDTADPRRLETGAPRWAEATLVALLLGAAALLLAFAVLIVADPDTQLLGATAGGGAALLAAALILAGKRVMPQETAVEPRPALAEPDEQAAVKEQLASGAQGVSRRAVIAGAAGVAGAGLCAAVALPVTAIGPGTRGVGASPWRRGLLLVSETGEPIAADELDERSFVTAFPHGADRRELGSPVVVVRVDPASLQLPAARRRWAPEGILAFSKICTHAGCAVSLYRSPQYEPLSPRPALVCPCHYSTFDPARAAKVVFGPAGRPLPQLPLSIDPGRRLVAAGPMSGSIGPAWFDTKHPLP